jgi:hypothetical protein
MADLACGGKGPVGNVPPNFPFQPVSVNFQAGEWVTVLDFAGPAGNTILVKATVAGPLAQGGGAPDVFVRWRRYGTGPALVAEGSFQGWADLNIYPNEVNVRVDFRVDTPNALIAIDVVEKA